MSIADHAWAFAEVSALVLIDLCEWSVGVQHNSSESYHFRQTSSCDDVASVDEAIQMPSGLFDLLAHVILTVEVEDIRHKIKRVLVVLDLGVETSQVETVGKVFFVDFTEVFVTTRGDELDREEVSQIPIRIIGKEAGSQQRIIRMSTSSSR